MCAERSRLEADALMEMAVAIAAGRPLRTVLHRLLDLVVELTRAGRGAVISIDPDGCVRDLILSGASGPDPRPGPAFAAAGVVKALLADTTSTRLQGLALPSSSLGFPAHEPPVNSLVGGQIRVLDHCYGCIYTADKRGDPCFTHDDERLVVALAAQAGTAVALRPNCGGAAGHGRLARGLHDDVVQTLFGIGMGIEAA